MKQIIFFTFLHLICGIYCGGRNDCESFNLNNEVKEELNAFSAAAIAFGNDPSMKNCIAYRDAAQDYLDAISSFRDCAESTGQLREFNQ